MSGSFEHRSDLPQTDRGQPKTQNDPKPLMGEGQIACCALFTHSSISKISSLQLTIHVSSRTACGISQGMHHCTLGTMSNKVIIGCFCTINAEIQKCSIIKCLQIIGWFGLNEDNWKQQTCSGFHIYYHCYF